MIDGAVPRGGALTINSELGVDEVPTGESTSPEPAPAE
jgi:hypothetical protein